MPKEENQMVNYGNVVCASACVTSFSIDWRTSVMNGFCDIRIDSSSHSPPGVVWLSVNKLGVPEADSRCDDGRSVKWASRELNGMEGLFCSIHPWCGQGRWTYLWLPVWPGCMKTSQQKLTWGRNSTGKNQYIELSPFPTN